MQQNSHTNLSVAANFYEGWGYRKRNYYFKA